MSDLIASHWPIFSGLNGTRCACGWREPEPVDLSDQAAKVWGEHVAAAIREANTITTEAELDALPNLSAVRTSGGYCWVKVNGIGWLRTGDHNSFRPAQVPLPATVLFRPV